MNPTLRTHRNLLAALVDELEHDGNVAKRKADDLATNARLRGRELDDHEDHLVTYNRAVQDAHANIVGRLRNILGAPLSTIVDIGAIFDAVEGRLTANARWSDTSSTPSTITPALAARVAAEVIDGRKVGDR